MLIKEAPVPLQFPEERQRRFGSILAYAADIGLAVSIFGFTQFFLDPAKNLEVNALIQPIGYTLLVAQTLFIPLVILKRSANYDKEEEVIVKSLNKNGILPVHDGLSMYSFVISMVCAFVLPLLYKIVFMKGTGSMVALFFLLPLATSVGSMIIPALKYSDRLKTIVNSAFSRFFLVVAGWFYIELLQLVILLIAFTPSNSNDLSFGGNDLFGLMSFILGYIPARLCLFYATGRKNYEFYLAVASILVVGYKLFF